ncbi:double-strand break repair protein AddB [Rhodovarius crocodyli]|uniref:Double-strand break repair protein AddB n=1 Tax=Rhodovarius crocodyli TaxID=1979269 RepID=A0A437LW74_9PROT|nr:double-strand break repair protein AddB [Rhodovarius crocodyli]RVT89629.1 double-strand break repair protein AddB [Rhodovarius crocodyli]
MRILTIPSGVPFLPALAAGLRERLPAPEDLARATILLPTRRSARALRAEFAPAEGGALLLPRLRALAGLSTEDADELALPALLELPPAVEPLRRQGELAALVQRLPPARGGPASPEQAWGLAGELAALLDEIALEEADPELLRDPHALQQAWLERLEGLVEGELAVHWRITTTFLRGVVEAWQEWLEDQQLLDIGVRRVLALATQADAWRLRPPEGLVVAAGIGAGGTIPAAARLLKVIAEELPQGFVVLHAEDPATAELPADALDTAPTHPFHGQRRLLRMMGAGLGPFPDWHAGAAPLPRMGLLGQALCPPAALPAWQSRRPDERAPALEGLSRQTAPDAEHEARAIALLLRGALEQPGASAALVTPDRDLARRTAAALARHGIEAEDSAGQPLHLSEAGVFLRLVAEMVRTGFAPVATLSALKHPLAAGNMGRDEWLPAARALELAAMRGPRPGPGLEGLRAALDPRAPANALQIIDALACAMAGFTSLPSAPSLPPAQLLSDLLAAAERLASSVELPGGLALYAGEEGEALANHLADMQVGFAALPPIAPNRFPPLFEAALSQGVARRPRSRSAHPRVAILGLLEARLLHFDRVVLGGLDEAIWPLATDPGPWMGRPMRAQFGLPSPEARIGRVAADFLLTAGSAKEVVLSRATRRGGSPTVPARWLTRLETFLAGQRNEHWPQGLSVPENQAVAWAAALDQPTAPITPAQRPRPAPPAGERPRKLSVTDAGLLLADPYSFYAKQVLRLRPLDPLEAEIGPAEYGELVHDTMSRFLNGLTAKWPGEDSARAMWTIAARDALEKAQLRPAVAAFWRPRLARIGDFVLEHEPAHRAELGVIGTRTEVPAEAVLHGVTLHGRADRVDELSDGRMAILDYKTGTLPSAKEVADGTAPQLPLEAVLAAEGGFRGMPAAEAGHLLYWRLTGGREAGEQLALKNVPELTESARAALLHLATDYLAGERPFTARPHPGRTSRNQDYAHLARVAEWDAGA